METKIKSSVNPLKSAKEQLLEKPIVEKEESMSVQETALEEGLRMMFEPENIEMRSDVSPPMVLAMSRGAIYVDRFNSKVMDKFMKEILIRSVSKGRKGRGELVALVRNSQDAFEEPENMASAFAKVMGKS